MASYGESGGFCNVPKVTYSQDTHNLLKDMMQESRLTNFQQRQLQKQAKEGSSLPLACNPTSSAKRRQPKAPAKPPKYLNPKNYHSNGMRTKEAIEASGAYERPKYEAGPVNLCKSYAKEKERCANIMAYGEDLPPRSAARRKALQDDEDYKPPPTVDRFDELQAEIDERQEFLHDMELVGQADKYQAIIRTEISQKVREMEVIDKTRTAELEELIATEEDKKTAKS